MHLQNHNTTVNLSCDVFSVYKNQKTKKSDVMTRIISFKNTTSYNLLLKIDFPEM